MPAHRKPVALHKLHGTYQGCRHDERNAKASNTSHRRTVPVWLPDNVKPVYRKLMDTLPPLDAVDETPLSQMAILKTQLQEDPDSMTSAQHGQLRALAGMIREWVKDYESAKAWKDKDRDNSFMQFVNNQPDKPITYEQFQGRRAERDNLPEGLKNCKAIRGNQDTCTNEPG